MIRLAKSILYWYERIAYEDVGGEKPDPSAPITLNRLWEVCKKYLWGSQRFLSGEWNGPNIYGTYHHTTYHHNFYFFDNSRYNSKEEDNPLVAFFIALALIWLASLMVMWVLSGIGFQYVLRNAIPATINFVNDIFRGIVGVLGAIAGIAISSVMRFFSNNNKTLLDYTKAGAKIGYELGSKSGEWIGLLVSIAIMPVAIVGAIISGIIVGLPMGALTLIIAPLQFINTTYNYINEKFQEEMQDNNTPKSSFDNTDNALDESFEQSRYMKQQPTTLLWSQQEYDKSTNTQENALDASSQKSLHLTYSPI